MFLDHVPRTAADQRRCHPGLGGRPDVVVEPVADVEDLFRSVRNRLDDVLEEPQIRLAHTQSSEVATMSTGKPSSRRIRPRRTYPALLALKTICELSG